MTLELHAIAQYSALRMVDSLAEGTVIALFAALLLRLARRQNAGTRFAIWFSALIAIAMLPVMSGTLSSRFGLSAAHMSRPAITLPDSWSVYLFAAWAVIAGWFLLGVVRALWHLYVLRKSSTPVDPSSLDPILQDTIRRTGMKRRVIVCTSAKVRVPTAIGLMKPAIVFPRWVLQELSASELNQIFLHELAHLRRWDDWTNLAQHLVRAVFFFHPAVWWIENQVALEREIACDDAVLAETPSPRAYAETLAHLAERSFLQRSVALAQAALGRIRQTSSRVAQILDVNRPKAGGRGWKPAVSLVAGFAIACAVGGSKAPRLVAFEDGRATNLSAAANITPPQDFPQAARVTQAKLTQEPIRTILKKRQPAAGVHPAISHQKLNRLLHLTSTKTTAVPFSETVFVLIQSGDQNSPAQQVYQFQMWRVTLLRFIPEPVSQQTPSKKT